MQDYRVLKVLLAVLIMIAPDVAHGQDAARVIGTVFMPYKFDEAVVPDVKIEFASDKTTTEATTDKSGKYAFTLPPGAYQETPSRAGFLPVEQREFRSQP